MLTVIDYIALDPIAVYWLGLNGIVAQVENEVEPLPSDGVVRAVLENL